MRGQGKRTRQRIIEVAYALFYEEGFMRSGVDAIAATAGVTKRTLYYHFESKDALLESVLEQQHQLAMENIRHWSDKVYGEPQAMIEALFVEFSKWANQPQWRGSGYTRIAMELANLPGHPARRVARFHKTAVEELLALKLCEVGVDRPDEIGRQIMLILEGCMTLTLIHGAPEYAAAAAIAAKAIVSRSAQDLTAI